MLKISSACAVLFKIKNSSMYIDAKYGVASSVQLAICVSDACLKRVNVE